MKTSRIAACTLICLALLFVASCAERKTQEVRDEMKDAFETTRTLFSYVWSDDDFYKPENRAPIQGLLERLVTDFHRVDSLSTELAREPGFAVTLESHREVLNDIRRRFSDGDKDYANWRLRGVIANCVSCHTRYQAPVDFVGTVTPPRSKSYQSLLSYGEFLVASRQFTTASKFLLELAKREIKVTSGTWNALEVLKLWLVVNVRVKSDFQKAQAELAPFIALAKQPRAAEIIKHWHDDLGALSFPDSPSTTLNYAKSTVDLLQSTSEVYHDDDLLVRALFSTSLLHPMLSRTELSKQQHEQALLILALTYKHINVRLLESFRDLYLETCIRQLAPTQAAEQCLTALTDEIEFRSSGSSGINITASDSARLSALRALLNGAGHVGN